MYMLLTRRGCCDSRNSEPLTYSGRINRNTYGRLFSEINKETFIDIYVSANSGDPGILVSSGSFAWIRS